MAIIKLGALAQDVRGSLNGSTFSRNRGGAYVRTKVSPVQPVTPSNTLARLLFGIISKRWSTVLTDAQRAGWDAFAAVHAFVNVFGDSIILSGVAFYQAANRRAQQAGQPFIDTAPANWDITNPGGIVIVATATAGALDEFTITCDNTGTVDETLYIFGTPPILAARAVQRNDFRLINSLAMGIVVNGSDIFADYNLRFSPLPFAAGDRLAVRVAYLNVLTGAISSSVLVDVEVA